MNQHGYPELDDIAEGYRAIGNQSWLEKRTGRAKANAFILKRERGEEGISLFMGEVDTCDKASRKLVTCHCVHSLTAGAVRACPDAELDMLQDEPDHGYVAGMPYYEDDRDASENVASYLLIEPVKCWPQQEVSEE